MPCLIIKTGKPLDSDALAGLLALASRTVAVMLGKPERYVMVMVDDGVPLFFAGSDAPAIYMELKSIGLPRDRTAEFSRALCTSVGGALGVPPDRIYIEFASAEPHLWGWNGATF